MEEVIGNTRSGNTSDIGGLRVIQPAGQRDDRKGRNRRSRVYGRAGGVKPVQMVVSQGKGRGSNQLAGRVKRNTRMDGRTGRFDCFPA